MTNIFMAGSICLSDIPKEYIKKSDKNGKMYLNVVISNNRQVGPTGNTHNMRVSVPREARAQGGEIFIGSFKEYESIGRKTYAPQPQYQNPSVPVNKYGETSGDADDWNF